MQILIIHQNFVDHQHPGGTRHLDIGMRLVEVPVTNVSRIVLVHKAFSAVYQYCWEDTYTGR